MEGLSGSLNENSFELSRQISAMGVTLQTAHDIQPAHALPKGLDLVPADLFVAVDFCYSRYLLIFFDNEIRVKCKADIHSMMNNTR